MNSDNLTTELIVAMFFGRHMDTLDISKMLNLTEATIYNILAIRPKNNLPSPGSFGHVHPGPAQSVGR